MGRDVMDDRKRALVLGKFKFLYQEDTEELETQDRFQLAIVQNKLLGPVQYTDKDGKSEEVLQIYGKERPAGEGYSNPPIDIPGVLDYFVVVWTNPFGEITVDQDIKLFEFADIQKYSTYNEGPKAKDFCQFHTSSTSTELDGFDASIFWSAGILWKHFKTCGVEKWDVELRELVSHYRNWQQWAHTVHNLPDNKKDKGGKFSNNKFSGPSATSGGYKRSRKREASPLPRSCLVNDPTKKQKSYPPASSSSDGQKPATNPPVPLISIPPPSLGGGAQPITIPIQGPGGQTIQVQLVCTPTAGGSVGAQALASLLPLTPITPGNSADSYTYMVNPATTQQQRLPPTPMSAPPPPLALMPPSTSSATTMLAPPSRGSSWTSAVDDFLTPRSSKHDSGKKKFERHLVPCMTSSPIRSRDNDEESRDSSKKDSKKKSKKYKPKAKIEAPKFDDEGKKRSGGKAVKNELPDEERLRMGVIKDWHGKFGFLRSDEVDGKIFLHSKDIKVGRELVAEGRKAFFQVLHYEKSVVGAKAVNVTVVED